MAKTVFNPELSDKESEIRDRLIVGVFHNFGYKRKRPKKSGPESRSRNPGRKYRPRIIERFRLIFFSEWNIQYAVIYKGYKVFNQEAEPGKRANEGFQKF